ncbi:lysophospholipid acyltransferase family protein [Clostridium sp.]|uniref:lysophospholipid acyltransferase family protein n=1 Tax=Clostridium sp. TaxID=1506 RepID=UPI003076DCC2
MFRAIKIVGTIVSFLVGSIGTLHRMDKQGQVDPVAVEEESTQMVRNIFEKLLKMAGVTVEVRGYENIPQDRPVLYVGNHRSYFDILVGYTTVPGLMGFVAKKEMEKIPLLSKWMLNVNCLFLDRNNIKEGLKTILAGIEKVRRGVSVWIFPEGTRNKNEQLSALLPFKEGSLKIAEKSGCPVIPVAMTGTAEVLEKHFPFITPSHITIYYGKPFYVKELEGDDRKHPGAYTRNVLIGMLKEMQTEE